jgi:hypothetical protein
MWDFKPIKVSIPMGEKLTDEHCLKTQEEIEDMSRVPYASVVGHLKYAMVCTQPNISHVVGVLRIYMSIPSKEHWKIFKRVFRYLCGTKKYSIFYQGKQGGDSELNVHGLVDTKWVGDLDR